MAKYETVTVTDKKPYNTLWGIAEAKLGNGARYTEIKKLNGLTSDTIHVGQVLKIREIPEEKDEGSEIKKAFNSCLSAIENLPEFQKLQNLL